MKILVYTGNHFTKFSLSGWNEHGGTGIINQTIKMADVFSARGHDVTVSGDVTTESRGAVSFCNTDDLPRDTHYDLVIAVSYIHFILALEERGITWDKSILQVHHPEPMIWWRGEALPDGGEQYFRDDRLTWIVALSEGHAGSLAMNCPYGSRKIRVIGNAVDPADWPEQPARKTPGKFIFCSGEKQALANLLEIWPRIRAGNPEATLSVATPYTGDENETHDHPEMTGVHYLGSLPVSKLRAEIASSEYWLNPSHHPEEYGVTMLEMMMGGVRVVSTDLGNLASLLEERGAIVRVEDTSVAEATLATYQRYDADPTYPDEYAASARTYAEQQNWDARYDAWMALIETTPKPKMKHPELYSYHDDKEAWEKRFLTYAARTKEWELIVEEPFDNCFSMPLFTEEFCHMIREEAEHAESWTTKRHTNFPTTDLLLQVIDMHDIYNAVLKEYVIPCSLALWQLSGRRWNNLHAESFLARYTAQAQGHLSLHHDESDITCLIQLSDLDEYEGGGTYFARQKQVVKNAIGHATIHPGNITHRHGGRAISSGLRYILVSFLNRPPA